MRALGSSRTENALKVSDGSLPGYQADAVATISLGEMVRFDSALMVGSFGE
jgi:hypothetical protein